MPLPKPRKNETHDEFIERCISDDIMKKEFPDRNQRIAICEVQWKRRKK